MPWDNKTLATLKAMGGGGGDYFGETVEKVTVAPLQTHTLSNIPWANGYGTNPDTTIFYAHLVEGREYTVTLNGASYREVAKAEDGNVYLGNIHIIAGTAEDTGVPFIYMPYSGEQYMLAVPQNEECTFCIETDQINIKTIDPKFLPNETLIEIIPETQITASEQGLLPITFALEAPLTYIVEYNDTKYECNAVAIGDGSNMGVGIGNMASGGMGDDTGEPFLFAVLGNQAVYTSKSDATVRIYKKGFSLQQIVTFTEVDGDYVADKTFSECVTAARTGSLVALIKYTKTDGSYNILSEIVATAYGLDVSYYENGLARNNFQIGFHLPNGGDEDFIFANLQFRELNYMVDGEITVN